MENKPKGRIVLSLRGDNILNSQFLAETEDFLDSLPILMDGMTRDELIEFTSCLIDFKESLHNIIGY